MSSRLLRGLGVGLVSAALWLGSVAAPAAASGSTLWVAANPGSGKGPAKCATAPYSSIQDAIDNANNWDTVMVCPGTYTEQLYINVRGLTVKSTGKHTAKLVAPAAMDSFDGETSLVVMDAYATKLVGFDIGIPSGDVVITPVSQATPQDGACTRVDVVVWAIQDHARVNRNNIHPIGPNSLSGECGYDYGIVFDTTVNNVAAASGSILTGSDVSRAGHNKITDFHYGGILAFGIGTRVHVDHNRLLYLHTKDPNCSVPFLTSGVSPQACTFGLATSKIDAQSVLRNMSKSSANAISPSQVNSAFYESFGIGAEEGAAIDADYNNIHSGLVFEGPGNSVLAAGIWLIQADGSSRLFHNSVTNTVIGIATGVGVGPVAPTVTPSVATDGVYLLKNQALNNLFGIGISDDANHLDRNTATANFFGGALVYGQDNLIENNNFAFNYEFSGYDCEDDTGPDLGSIMNTWTNNLGVDSSPDGLCTSPFPPAP